MTFCDEVLASSGHPATVTTPLAFPLPVKTWTSSVADPKVSLPIFITGGWNTSQTKHPTTVHKNNPRLIEPIETHRKGTQTAN